MKKIIEDKVCSILIIIAIYIVAVTISVFVYNKLPYSGYVNILIADVVATIVVYVFSLIFDNASVYDPYWSVQPIVIIIGYAMGKNLDIADKLVIFSIILWGIRLTLNWAYTFPNLTKQDWRYTKYKEETGKLYQIVNFFGIHMMPTLLVYFALIPALSIIDNNCFNMITVIGFIISICAVMIQGTADYQMHRFRSKKTHKLIRDGLWKYSRHPNYLGEILMWWGVAIQSVSVTKSLWSLCGAVLILLLFLTVSIPLADKRQSKKSGYDKYIKATRCLLPIPKRIK
jgi:steroid 5-alpha reductase family enzyme